MTSMEPNGYRAVEAESHAVAVVVTPLQALWTWWIILRISIEERLVYRGDFALGTLMRFLPLVTQVFLWGAIFQAVRGGTGQGTVAGYTNDEMIAYLLLTQISRAFSSMPGLASGIAL